jgi:hypothetical protein
VFAELNRYDEAQQTEQEAIDLATATKSASIADMRQRLELFKNHQPWRESFVRTNGPEQSVGR